MLERDKNLDIYFNEIKYSTPLSREKEIELSEKIKKGCRRSLNQLVKANLKFVIKVANNYKNMGFPFNDLIGYGNMGLIKAAQNYDGTRGLKFISHAVWWIRHNINYAIMQKSTMIRVPANHRELLTPLKKSMISMENAACEKGKHFQDYVKEKINMHGALRDKKNPPPDEIIDRESNKKEVKRLLGFLDDDEREIVKLYYGIDHGTNYYLEDIASRFGITRERVRQIKEKAIHRIRLRNKLSKKFTGYR